MAVYGFEVLDAQGAVHFDSTARNARWHGRATVPANTIWRLDIGLPVGAQGVAIVIPSSASGRLPQVGFNGGVLTVGPYVTGSGAREYDTISVDVIYGSW